MELTWILLLRFVLSDQYGGRGKSKSWWQLQAREASGMTCRLQGLAGQSSKAKEFKKKCKSEGTDRETEASVWLQGADNEFDTGKAPSCGTHWREAVSPW